MLPTGTQPTQAERTSPWQKRFEKAQRNSKVRCWHAKLRQGMIVHDQLTEVPSDFKVASSQASSDMKEPITRTHFTTGVPGSGKSYLMLFAVL